MIGSVGIVAWLSRSLTLLLTLLRKCEIYAFPLLSILAHYCQVDPFKKPQKCAITGKKPLFGNHVSHANNKVKRRQNPNLHTKKIYIPEMDKHVKVRLSARALRTIDKKGLLPFLKDQGLTLKDISN